MQSKYFEFDLEDASMYLSCAIENLRLIREEMEEDLLAQQKTNLNLGPGHLLDCCDAMCTALRELDRVNDGLSALVDAAYERKRG